MVIGNTRLRHVLVDGLGGGAMSEQKIREALELADAALSGANMNMNVVERKVKAALAQHSAAYCATKQEASELAKSLPEVSDGNNTDS
jgi:hypothetical protein